MYNHQRILTSNDLNREKLPEELRRKLDCFDDAQRMLSSESSTGKYIRMGVKLIDSMLCDELSNFVKLNIRFISLFQNRTESVAV
jgi:hypothetical protein